MQYLNTETTWLAIGLLGQALFFLRFFIQWLASEKAGHSVMPNAFWYFSLLGGITLFSYAIWRRDPVFIIGQSTGLFIYMRNIYFLRRDQRTKEGSTLEQPIISPGGSRAA